MFPDDTRNKIENITQGIIIEGYWIIAHQPEISYAAALQQVQRLKQTSKVSQSLKKSRLNS
jgi:hypothetical protein